MSKLILLTRGLSTVVDDEDFGWLSEFSWSAVEGRNGSFYAGRAAVVSNADGSVRRFGRQMQRDLLDRDMKLPRDVLVDHINGDTLYNRKHNLRLADYHLSNVNRSRKPNASGYRWVMWDKSAGHFYVHVKSHGITHCGGRIFHDPHEAAEVANELALRVHGPSAVLNVINRGGGSGPQGLQMEMSAHESGSESAI